MPQISDRLARLRLLNSSSEGTPSWENPEESIGDFCRTMGRSQCWHAEGPARDLFFQLADEIKIYLDRNCEPPSRELHWSLYMIGRSKSTARPVLMFICEDSNSRRSARKTIKESGILLRYPGVDTADCSYPPDVGQLVHLASRHRGRSQSRGGDAASRLKSRNKRMAAASFTGVATDLIEGARSKTRSRSKSRTRQDLNLFGHASVNARPLESGTFSLEHRAAKPSRHRSLDESKSNHASSWSYHDDSVLMNARARGQRWSQIQKEHFQNKSANACRKRHERLVAKRRGTEWSQGMLEKLSTEYS